MDKSRNKNSLQQLKQMIEQLQNENAYLRTKLQEKENEKIPWIRYGNLEIYPPQTWTIPTSVIKMHEEENRKDENHEKK